MAITDFTRCALPVQSAALVGRPVSGNTRWEHVLKLVRNHPCNNEVLRSPLDHAADLGLRQSDRMRKQYHFSPGDHGLMRGTLTG